MTMEKRRIRFLGFSPAVPLQERLVYRLLAKHYDIDPEGNPDYVVSQYPNSTSQLGYDDCVKIHLNGENVAPDFNDFDYVVGFDHLTFGGRYFRSPLFVQYRDFRRLAERKTSMTDQELLNRKFCSFVVSNSQFADPMRRLFFERLNKYKKVDSGGRYLNNVGGPVRDKLSFCRAYKFNIAFENSLVDGYTTEKIMEAYAAESVPIYYGNPTVETDFRLESMIRVRNAEDVERAVEEVIRLDNDDEAYLAKCREKPFAREDPLSYERELEAFLCSIFNQPLETARRRAEYGYQKMVREHMRKIMKIDRVLVGIRDRVLRVFG